VATEREKILLAAQKYVDKRQYDRAIKEYQKIVQQDPRDARTLLKIGDLQARMQAYADAVATYDRVGQYYASQGFALKAIAVYKQVRELIRTHAPELADRYGHVAPKLAEIYTQLGLSGDALSAWDEVATRYQRAGRDREAIQVFEKMVEIDGSNPLPRVRLAEALCRVQDLDRAVATFWSAAELLKELDRSEDALKVIERILHFRQDPPYARAAAEIYLKRGTREDALQSLAKLQICFQANPKDLETLALLAQAFVRIDAEAKAIEVYKEMARIAREQGRRDVFESLMAHLRTVAPHDEQVAALESLAPRASSMGPPSSTFEPAASSAPGVSTSIAPVDDSELEIIEEVADSDAVPVDEETEAAEELQTTSEVFDRTGHVRKALVDAESFRRLRLYSKAAEVLTIALELDPRAIEVRNELRKIHEESGKLVEAAGEAVVVATLELEAGRFDAAKAAARDALRLVPDHTEALGLLGSLGEPAPGAWEHPSPPPPAPSLQAYDPQAPLPSYDLEEVSAALAMGADLDGVDDPFGDLGNAPLPSFPLGGEDEPFGGAPEYPTAVARPGYERSLAPPGLPPAADPRFPGRYSAPGAQDPYATGHAHPGYDSRVPPGQEPPAYDPQYAQGYEQPGYLPPAYDPQQYAQGYEQPGYVPPAYDPQQYVQGYEQPGYEQPGYEQPGYEQPGYEQPGYDAQYPQGYDAPNALGTAGYAAPPADANHDALEEALEEAEFFSSRGLHDDARAILQDQLTRTPNHPLVLERLREVEQAARASGESGTIERSRLQASRGPVARSGEPRGGAFEIAAGLGAIEPSPARGRKGAHAIHDEIDVDQVFAQFKEGVRQQVSEADAATHYDLGVAYKEMMLLSDAVSEFELAARDPERECTCYAMIGMIELEQGSLDAAEAAYKRGFEAKKKTVEQEMSLYYDLGIVMEMKRQPEEALYYFRKIARRDPAYRDVSDRIAELERSLGRVVAPPPKRSVGEDDEFDAVFDDLFESK